MKFSCILEVKRMFLNNVALNFVNLRCTQKETRKQFFLDKGGKVDDKEALYQSYYLVRIFFS